jgi:hypothetical protein
MTEARTPEPSLTVRRVAEVRSEYASARLICSSLESRVSGAPLDRNRGYVPPEIDYLTEDGQAHTISIRDYDVRFLDRVPEETALGHLALIHRARLGDADARRELERRTRETHEKVAARFAGRPPVENEYVIPYTTPTAYSERQVSHKGSVLLDLSRRGFATADFSILTSSAYRLDEAGLEAGVKDALGNLEILSGRRFADPHNPLLVAVRSAVPDYVPGFMPTYLNVGLTPEAVPGLPKRYGPEAAVRIVLNNRKTLLEIVDPPAYALVEKELRPGLSPGAGRDLIARMEGIIRAAEPGLLENALAQVLLCVSSAYAYFRDHQDVLRNFARRGLEFPAIILQRMVCSVIDRQSYAGVLYSRHPRLGTGVFLQFARTIYGEDLMTGRLQPEERHFLRATDALEDFPAVYHFWNRLFQLEDIFRGPVMVEFTGVHGTFTVLQVNAAELAGAGMLTAVMDLYREGRVPAARVRELIQAYHVRQIESDAIDPRSLQSLRPFGRGVAVLPRSAVSGRLYFSTERARQAKEEKGVGPVLLVKERFAPQDAVDMQQVDGICSLSPAAIHVVTAAQNLGIPALLNLEEAGLRIDAENRRLVNREGRQAREGDWMTISSRMRTLFEGRALFAPARLLRFMAGEKVPLSAGERPRFERLARDYREYRTIAESAGPEDFQGLQDLGHAILYGQLSRDPGRAGRLVNHAFDLRPEGMAAQLLGSTLGTHAIVRKAYERLTPERRVRLLREAIALCRLKGVSGYQAGSFVVGSLVEPESPIAFWKRFAPAEIAFLANEWVLHEKYLRLLEDVGERKVNRAREIILSRGLTSLPLPATAASGFIRLKLGRLDLDAVLGSLPEGADPQTVQLLTALQAPYGSLCDYSSLWDMTRLDEICREEGLSRPGPEDS